MAIRSNAAMLRQIQTLFDVGVIGDLTDAHGTVKSRLARARQLLRSRLTARGLAAPTILALTEAATNSVDAAFSLPIVDSTLRAVLLTAKAPRIGVVSVSVANLAEEVMQTMFLTQWKLTWAGLWIAGALTAGTAAVMGRQNGGSNPNSVAGRPAARTADLASPAGERGGNDVPDFVKQSRGMIVARLEQEHTLARAGLDRTLKSVAAPDAPAALQARRTVDEIESLLARIDGVLVNAVDRFPTMFDFSGEQVDLTSAPGSANYGMIPWLNGNDLSQSSADKSGNWQKGNRNDLAPSQNTKPSSGGNKDGARARGNRQSSSAKSGDSDLAPGQSTKPFEGTSDSQKHNSTMRGGGISRKSTMTFHPRENELRFQQIDKIRPGEEVVLGFVGKVTSPFPTQVTCRASATHAARPEGEKLEDAATVTVNKSIFQ